MKFTWLAAAAVLAGWMIARRHRQARWFQAVELVAIAAAVLIGLNVIELPNFQQVLEDAGKTLGAWTYLVVGALAFAETGAFLGFIAPGETAVIVGGLVAGQGQISLLGLIAVVWCCAVAGDLTSYVLGKRLGRRWLLHYGARLKITEARLDQVEHFLEKRGGPTIIVGRFLGFVRPLSPFIAGASRMPLRRFAPYDVLAAGAWAVIFSVLGFLFWRSIDQLTTYVSRGLFAFGTLVALVAAIVVLVHLRRDPSARAKVRAWLDARSGSRFWRLVARLARPAWRATDLATRAVTLEYATLLALLAVGAFAFFALGAIHPEPRADRWAFSVADSLRMTAAVDVAKVVTYLGSSPVTAALVLATALFARRDAAPLVAGWLLTFAAAHIAKSAYDRPRPPGALVETANASYPSGHSAYAVALIACALVLVRAGVGWAVRIAAVSVAAVLVAVVLATRVYLRAHYLTDTLGGAALGIATWSLVGLLTLAARRVRHNGGG